jgi:hypothetical protein
MRSAAISIGLPIIKMQKAITECVSSRVSIEPALVVGWAETLYERHPAGSLLCITTPQFKELIMPAFRVLGSYQQPDGAPDVDIGRARLTLNKFMEVSRKQARNSPGPVRAGQGVPEHLRNKPELTSFVTYSQRLLERGVTPDFLLITIEFEENVCFVFLVDLHRRKLEIVSTFHNKLDYHQAKEMEDAAVWFSLYQFSRRVHPVRTLKMKPELYLNNLAIVLYLLLRLHDKYQLPYEIATLSCTLANLKSFVEVTQGDLSKSIQVHSNLMFSN